MSPDDMADYHAYMAVCCEEMYMGNEGLMSQTWKLLKRHHRESARYWREKAKENADERV